MKIFFSAGEPSGDLHAANLIRELHRLRPDIECVGYGGPKMAAAGCKLHYDLTSLAVMWFLRVLVNLHKFLALAGRASAYFRHQRPDAVVLVDYPGFNWWIAKRAKAAGIPVFYYCPPQIWAWASHRVNKMRKYVDHVLCTLPFERDWLAARGCHATFVGHPFFDEVRQHPLDCDFLATLEEDARPLVTILPGSRTQEVENNLKWMLRAAARVHQRVPQAKFAIASFKPHQAELARRAIVGCDLPIDVYVGRTPELMQSAHCCLAVSGSVSLELLHYAKPTVILYHISSAAYWVQGFFRRVKYITLVNLLSASDAFGPDLTPYDPAQPTADEVLFPEYLTCVDKSAEVSDHMVEWLTDSEAYRQRVVQLEALRNRVGDGGASQRAVRYLLNTLDARPRPVRRPHFLPRQQSPSAAA